MEMKAFDCFSGGGGFRILTEPQGIKFVGWCENNKYAQMLYRAYYNTDGEYFCNDATKINTNDLPDFDIFFGGFPCQAFSIAGKRQGFKDIRGALFFEIARICQDKKPKYIILENVKGLLDHDDGRTFSTIIGVLSDIGYSIEWQVLYSKYFEVPQDRKRIYIVGYLGKESRSKILPIQESNYVYNEAEQEEVSQIACCIKAGDNTNLNGNFIVEKIGNVNPSGRGQNGNIFDAEGLCPTLTTNKGEGIKIYDGYRFRRLTPLECARLQGFPDDILHKAYEIGISDNQLYKIFGNAVTATIPREIIKLITEKEEYTA